MAQNLEAHFAVLTFNRHGSYWIKMLIFSDLEEIPMTSSNTKYYLIFIGKLMSRKPY